jgi:hypothetical protein
MLRDEVDFVFEGREKHKNSLEYASDLDRLNKYKDIVRAERDFAKDGLDMSRFSSYFEHNDRTVEDESAQVKKEK